MTVHYLFYKPKRTDLIGQLIRWQTRGSYSHVAVLFDRHDLYESVKWAGVIQRCLEEHDYEADWLRLDGWRAFESRMRHIAVSRLGQPYDWRAIIRFVDRRRWYRNDAWFCSEFGYSLATSSGVQLFRSTKPWEVSPNILFRSPLFTVEENKRNV